MKCTSWLGLVSGLAVLLAVPFGSRAGAQAGEPAAGQSVEAALLAADLWLDLERGVLAVPATVLQREELLEYLLVGPGGATHESLFVTEARPSTVNAGLLLLGVDPGRNAWWEDLGKADDGLPHRRLHPPSGGGFYLYAAWREGEETFFFRIEDLIADLASGRTLGRHRWVYLASRFETMRDGSEAFMADVEGNLVNLSFFFHHNTLLTAAREECIEQTVWAANAWLVPPQGQTVRLFFARERLAELPEGWEARLPLVTVANVTVANEVEDGPSDADDEAEER